MALWSARKSKRSCREAVLIQELQPPVNVQIGAPDLETREVPPALVRDVLVLVPSVEEDSVELVGARADGGCLLQRTRRNGADLAVHTVRLTKVLHGARRSASFAARRLAPIVFSWLGGPRRRRRRGSIRTTRASPRALAGATRRAARGRALFTERLVIYSRFRLDLEKGP